ncbi:HinT-interacting membrane complex protein P80 [Mycoplasmopsis cricetuli]|uniref:HinT-interacting membrane complex protein P80 n=1 Tax=Mycoplasmopsis cricetuli TaxID=171283 RepID=UPI0004725B22|nr:hypothetical protein [Mycoplasmopsis cricetuli]
MAKRQKSFFERLSEVNSKHEEKFIKPTNQKKRNKLVLISLGLLSAIIVSAITIPLLVSITKVNYVDAVKPQETILEFSDKENKKIDLTAKQLQSIIEGANENIKEKSEELYKNVISFWYDKEVEASIEYQRVWNSSRYNNESEQNNIALKTYDQINTENKNKLEDLKLRLQSVYGFENWKKQFETTLNTDEYGKSSTEEDALNYLNFKQIEEHALRHFRIDLQKNVNVREINRFTTKDIYKVDADGNVIAEEGKPVILFSKGEKIAPYFIAQSFETKENANFAVNSTNSNLVTYITTKTFIPKFKSVTPLIEKYFRENKLVLPAIYQLPGIINKNLSSPWSFDKDSKKVLINLGKYLVNKKDNKFEIKRNIDVLKNFKLVNDYVIPQNGQTLEQLSKERSEVETLFDLLTVKTKNLGSRGITTVAKEFENDFELGLSFINNSILRNRNLPEVSISKILTPVFEQHHQQKIDEMLEKANRASNDNEVSKQVFAINRYIDSIYDNLSEKQFSDLIIKQFNKNIVLKVNEKELYSYIYKISDMNDAYLIISDKGTFIVRNTAITNKKDLFELFQNDLYSIANNNESLFKFSEILNNVYDKYSIIKETLNNDEFVKYLLEKENKFNQNKKYTDKDIQDLKTENASIMNGNITSEKNNLILKSNDWIKEKLNGLSYNLFVENGISKFVYNWNPLETSAKSASDILVSEIDKIVKGDK